MGSILTDMIKRQQMLMKFCQIQRLISKFEF